MPKKHSTCIVNLDSLGKQGTHWVCCMPSNFQENELWYFDSLGMLYPHEFEKSAQKDKVNVIFNTAQYQNLLSVLCGYYYLFVLHKWSEGLDYCNILKPFSHTNTSHNKQLIRNYFINM